MTKLPTSPSDEAASTSFGGDLDLEGSIESGNGEGSSVSAPEFQEKFRDIDMGDGAHSRIAERAFLLYAESGFQHGHDLDHWLEAERDITTQQ